MAINNLVKSLQNIMRRDAGINGDAQRIEQMVWLIFLKVYDAQEEDWEIDAMDRGEDYVSIIPEALRWRNWAPSKDEDGRVKADFLTGDSLLRFVNGKLFPVLKGNDSDDGTIRGIRVTRETPRYQSIVREVFEEANQYMKNGVELRNMIDAIDAIDLMDSEESHAFGDIYENILKDLQSAGNAGEFYTPRALTDFIIRQLNPRLGEVVGDFAMGTGGFLVSALKHLEPQKRVAADENVYQQSIIGQEWKPFPYLLAVTNILLHGIKSPQLFHDDSLSHPMSDYHDEGKVDVIAMNPPYGGATDAATKNNFKAEFRSSETADLFMVLIMERLSRGGRAGVIVPDGFLFGTDGAKLAIKRRLLRDFNLHTIVRLPGSIFSPYTSIATNILFFNNERADQAPEGYHTARTWFYRLDMPEGYKHFSKTKPMQLQHFAPFEAWDKDRQEIVSEADEKARCFTAEQLEQLACNFDQCKFPKEEEEILPPDKLIRDYKQRREALDKRIDDTLAKIEEMLGIKTEEA